jgi:hypothetical protein
MLLVLLVGSQSTLMRKEISLASASFKDVDAYWKTGQYINTLGNDFSTITTDEMIAGVVIFASSGVPGASHNIYYFVDQKYLKPTPVSFDSVRDSIRNGQKVESLWILEDWIFGGQYYLGRHARYTFDYSFTEKINKRIISDYHERFYIHDKNLEKTKFLNSIEPVKNKIYDNPKAVVYNIEVGMQ